MSMVDSDRLPLGISQFASLSSAKILLSNIQSDNSTKLVLR